MKKRQSKYKTMKVFNCQDMPPKVKEAFFAYESFASPGNDCYVKWHTDDKNEDSRVSKVSKWLLNNGAGHTTEVLIKHWW